MKQRIAVLSDNIESRQNVIAASYELDSDLDNISALILGNMDRKSVEISYGLSVPAVEDVSLAVSRMVYGPV
jgi:hypothetical protein